MPDNQIVPTNTHCIPDYLLEIIIFGFTEFLIFTL